jgi:hypothetical protein
MEMSENLNTDKTAFEKERQELNLLVKRGVKFDVTSKIRKKDKGLNRIFRKSKIVEETVFYMIKEPTLSVLDRMSDIWLDMDVNEELMKDESVLIEAKRIVKENTRRMARIVAIAVLGEDYHITEVSKSGKIKRLNDDKELNRLTDIFFHSIKPSKLVTLSTAIINMSNLGDFLASMRLMSGARTTQPRKDRIE